MTICILSTSNNDENSQLTIFQFQNFNTTKIHQSGFNLRHICVYIEFIQNSKKSSPCGIFSFILYLLANFCFNLINWIKNENEIFSRMPPGLVSNCFFFSLSSRNTIEIDAKCSNNEIKIFHRMEHIRQNYFISFERYTHTAHCWVMN